MSGADEKARREEARRIMAGLSPHAQTELLRRIREKAKAAASQVIPPAAEFRPSFAQRRLWSLQQLEPDNPAYLVAMAVEIEGPLSLSAWRQAIAAAAHRHEVLRHQFELGPDGDLTCVDGFLPEVFRADVALPGAGARDVVHHLLREQLTRPFAAEGALVRFLLVEQAPERHLVSAVLHHAISDAWSLAILVRDLVAIYANFRAGTPSALPDLNVRYRDFSAWQESLARNGAFDEMLRNRVQQLSGASILELPTDRPRSALQAYEGASAEVRLSESEWGTVKAFARDHQGTPFSVLLSAFAALLGRWSGQEDFAVGIPVAGRSRQEFEPLVGLFVNTVAVRVRSDRDPPFRDLHRLISQEVVAAVAAQDVPFERLVEALQPLRDLSRNPVFDVMAVLQNAPRSSVDLPGLSVKPVPLARQTAKFDLTLDMYEGGGTLIATLEYAKRLFDATTATRLLDSLRSLLSSALADPQHRLSELDAFGEAGRHQLTHEWNDTAAMRPGVLDTILSNARRTPDAIAVEFDNQALSYGELLARAGGVASFLVALGAGPDTVVAVRCRRGIEVPVALLGVLLSGAAYLPVDPAFPAERVRFMLADSAAPILLTDEMSAPEAVPATMFVVELSMAARPDAMPERAPVHDSLAYVIYTSGSTGRPKGVLVHRASLAMLLQSFLERPGISEGDRLAAVTTVSFDIAGLEIFLPFVAGATLLVVDTETAHDGEALRDLLEEQQATFVQATPSTWRLLVSAGWSAPDRVAALCGGEALPQELADDLVGRARELWNVYGPTETTIWSTRARVHKGERIVVGRPLLETSLTIAGPAAEPAPIGTPGELHIGGGGLARGYLDRLAHTADRFVPGGPSNGTRRYRPGDLARRLADGSVEYLGRLDYQVKIRGHRIETGEVESVLARQDSVEQAVVVAFPDPLGTRLVAYVRLRRDVPWDVLRDHLRSRLPDYMVPSEFVALAAFPLTPNGKVDRKALPRPGASDGRTPANEDVTPRSETEAVLANVFSEVLNRELIALEADFFSQGGDSIRSILVATKARQRGLRVRPRDIFLHRSVRALATALQREGEPAAAPDLHTSTPAGTAFPLTPLQRGILFHALTAESSELYVQQYTYWLEGEFDARLFRAAWKAAAQRHAALRTGFRWAAVAEPEQRVFDVVDPPWHEEDLSEFPQDERERRVLEFRARDRRTPFDLAGPWMLRLALFRTQTDRFAFVWTHHHLVLDGWSVALVTRDVLMAYEALLRGEPLPAAPARPFRKFVEWLGRQDHEAARRWWRGSLQGASVPTTVDARSPVREGGGAKTLFFRLGAQESARLRECLRVDGSTPAAAVHAAWAIALSAHSASDDVVWGATLSGRSGDLDGIEGMVGMFINTLPLRLGLAPRELLSGAVRRVFDQLWAVRDFEHASLPDIRRWSGIASDRSLFETLVVFENYPMDRGLGEIPDRVGLRIGRVEQEEATNYPLTVVAAGTDELAFRLLYDTRRIDAVTAERVASHLLEVLRRFPERWHAPLHAQSVRTRSEEHQLLYEWNDTATEYRQPSSLARLLRSGLDSDGDATSLTFDDLHLSRSEVLRLAERIGTRLAALGVAPEVPVAVNMERSLELVLALAGVAFAGAPYVPVDPEYPAERQQFMLRDAGASIVLTHAALGGRSIPGARDIAGLIGNGTEEEIPAVPIENAPEDLAYVIFTSGSTGRPKGVGNTHHGLSNRLAWMQACFQIGRDDVVLQKTPFGFDVSVWEFFWPLMVGARLAVSPPGIHRDPAALTAEIDRTGTTTIHFVPTLLEAFTAGDGLRCLSLRQIICSGEALSADLQRRASMHVPSATIDNLYGPTEAAIDVSWWHCPPSHSHQGALPIGRPIWNTTLVVADHEGRPAPIEVAGELQIGGIPLARGYVGRPALTAERFVATDNFAGRAYRTGDLARFAGDGTIEYLGRIDFQVKVRGNRIELGEIEHALQRLPGVRRAVVLANASGGSMRLHAFVQPQDASGLDVTRLRSELQKTLPDFMVPAGFLVVDEFPVGATGKLDRKALLEASASRSSRRDGSPPRSHAERALAEVWQDVLRVESVSRDDDFFALGGDSLLSIQIASRAAAAGWRVGVLDVLRHPRLSDLAIRLSPAPTTVSSPDEYGDVPLTPIQHWFFETVRSERDHFNQALAFDFADRVAPSAVRAALDSLVRRHDALRLRCRGSASDIRATIVAASEAVIPLTVIDLVSLTSEDARRVRRAATERVHGSLSIADGPIAGAALFHEAAGARLLLVIHHMAIDVVSWLLLIDQFAASHRGALEGRPAFPLPPGISWRGFAIEMERAAREGQFDVDRAYWRAVARRPVRPLPRGDAGSVNGERVRTSHATLGRDATRALTAAFSGGSLQTALLAAVAAAIGPMTGGDFRVDVESHGRDALAEADLSGTVGWFTAIYPVILGAASGDTPAAVLGRTRGALDAIPSRGISYGALCWLVRDPELLAARQADVLFNFLGALGGARAQSSFRPSLDDVGEPRSRRSERAYALEIQGFINSDGHLVLAGTSTDEVMEPGKVQALLDRAMAFLVDLPAHADATTSPASGHSDAVAPGVLLPLQPSGSLPPLLFMHQAFGDALAYRHLTNHLPATLPVFGVQSPSIGTSREDDVLATVDAMLDRYLPSIVARFPHGPILLAGHSGGGILAFEAACRLARSRPVPLVAILDQSAPPGPSMDAADLLYSRFALNDGLPLELETLKRLTIDEAIASVLAAARQSEKLPLTFDPDRARKLLRVFLANQMAFQRHRPSYYDGTVVLFRAIESRARYSHLPDDLGWAQHAKGLEIVEVPGSHLSLIEEPHARPVAATLMRWIDLACKGASAARDR